MSKVLRKIISVMAVMTMSTTTLCMPAQASTNEARYYATNPSGYGKSSKITIDGDFKDWTANMLIAQGVANDDARIFRGSHEGPVYDTYGLYGAWDDENLYLMWQFTNVTDVVDPSQGYPMSDNGKPWNGNIPQIIALSIDPTRSGNGKCINGKVIDDNIWGINVNYETPVDTLLYFSSKPGVGEPALFKVNDKGYFDYSTAVGFKEAGISFKYGDGLHPSIKSLMGIHANGYMGYTPSDLQGNTTFSWTDMLQNGHDTNQDTMYEMAIPLSSLGITKEYIEKNGIGAMHISTFGQSGIASIPQDSSMLDVATKPYSADDSTSAEKEDMDVITAPLAEIGTDRGILDKDDMNNGGNNGEVTNPDEKDDNNGGSTNSGNTKGDEDTTIETSDFTAIPVSQIGTGSSQSGSGTSTENGLADSVHDGTILHAWNWSLATIKSKLPEIAAAGYTTVQTSPLQGTKENSKEGSKWWVLYQPTNFKIGNSQLGSRDELIDLCKAADNYGIKIIVDVIFNHTANQTADNISPMVDAKLRNNSNFWHSPFVSIENYDDRWKVTHQDACNLPDLNTSNKELQGIIIDYLKDLINCGVDGFRVDTAKHIELPSDPDGSDFWPTITSAIKDDNVLMYGEVLQGGADGFSGYAPYINLSASNYGGTLRDAVGFSSTKSIYNVHDYNANGVDASKLITFVETHDTYSDDKNVTTYMNDWQIKMGWAITAARAYVTPLYFDRPTSNSSASKFAPLLGTAGNNNWQDADTVAVNKFHNAMVGEGENLKVINNQLLMIERGSNGVVLVNLGGQTAISTPTSLKAGEYINHGSTGGTFTSANNRLSGNVPAGGIAVLYSNPTNGPVASIKGESATFKADTMNITLGASNAESATYSIDGGSEVTYKNDQVITIGKDQDYNTVTTVTVKAKKGDQVAETSCKYIKLDPQAQAKAYFDNAETNWSDINAYVYDKNTLQAVEKWPGVAMANVEGDLYSYSLPSTLNHPGIIFNDGNINQIPSAQSEGYSINSPMIYTKGEMCYYLPKVADKKKPIVSISPASTTFKGDTLTLKLGVKNADQGVYSIDGGAEKTYSNDETVTLTGITKGQIIKVTLKATNVEGSAAQTYTYTNTDVQRPTVKEGELKAYIYKPVAWGENVNIYAYDETSSKVKELAAWPGASMTAEGNGLYSYELDGTWKNAKIIFNDGVNQYPVTEGLTLDCSRYYDNGEWMPCEVIQNNELAVNAVPGDSHYKGSLNVTLGVTGSASATYSIDGKEAESYTNGEVITIGEGVAEETTITLTLTATNAEGKVVTQTYSYYKDQDVEEFENLYFKKPSDWGTNINVYIYDETSGKAKVLAAWPGIKMNDLGNDYYSYTLPTEWKYAQVIFNDGNRQVPGSGEAGLVFDGTPMIYKNGVWKAFNGFEVSENKIAYFDNSSMNWNTVNAYVYDESGSSIKEIVAWPGAAMTSEGNNLYSFTLTKEWENAKVIFNNGNAQIPASGQNGLSLNGNMIYSNGQWTNY